MMILFILLLSIPVSYSFTYPSSNVCMKTKVFDSPMSLENEIFQENLKMKEAITENMKKPICNIKKIINDNDYEIPHWVEKKAFRYNRPGLLNKKKILKDLDRMLR